MMLSVKARLFVSDAVTRMPNGAYARDVWRSFDRDGARDLPPHVARVALQALEFAERELADRLNRAQLDEDEHADLSNDLYYIRTLEGGLRQQDAR